MPDVRAWATFAGVRRVVVFLLGVFVIVDSVVGEHDSVGQLAIGAVMVGVLPLDGLVAWATAPWHTPARRERDDAKQP